MHEKDIKKFIFFLNDKKNNQKFINLKKESKSLNDKAWIDKLQNEYEIKFDYLDTLPKIKNKINLLLLRENEVIDKAIFPDEVRFSEWDLNLNIHVIYYLKHIYKKINELFSITKEIKKLSYFDIEFKNLFIEIVSFVDRINYSLKERDLFDVQLVRGKKPTFNETKSLKISSGKSEESILTEKIRKFDKHLFTEVFVFHYRNHFLHTDFESTKQNIEIPIDDSNMKEMCYILLLWFFFFLDIIFDKDWFR